MVVFCAQLYYKELYKLKIFLIIPQIYLFSRYNSLLLNVNAFYLCTFFRIIVWKASIWVMLSDTEGMTSYWRINNRHVVFCYYAAEMWRMILKILEFSQQLIIKDSSINICILNIFFEILLKIDFKLCTRGRCLQDHCCYIKLNCVIILLLSLNSAFKNLDTEN